MNEKFANWTTLFLQYLKRDWKKIIAWVLGLGLFSAGFVPAFQEIVKGEALVGMFETLKNPAMTSMIGPTPIQEASEYTIGALYTHDMLLFCSLFAMIVAVLHTISHTRKAEDHGLTELLRSFQVGRQANSLAVIVEIILINIVLTIFIAVTIVAFNVESMSGEGAVLFALSIGMAGVLGTGIALVMAQIMPTSSAATGATLGIIGLLYIIRAGTDVTHINISMFNPLGWTYLTYPFTENDWRPLIFIIGLSCVIFTIAFILEGRRDMGAGYLPQSEGRSRAQPSLLSVRGLFFKINKGMIIAWLTAFIVLGAAYGSIYGDMQTFLEGNDLLKKMFTQSGASIEASFTSTIMMVLVLLVSILPIVIINKLYSEERSSRLSQIFATKVTRGQIYWTVMGLAICVSLIGILLAASGLGLTAMRIMTKQSNIGMGDFLAAGYNFFPTVLFLIGLSSLALGWAPNLGKFVYGYLIYSFMLTYFEGILDLPNWFLNTAILNWMPQMPMEKFDITIFITITILSVLLIGIGYLGYHRRDLNEGV